MSNVLFWHWARIANRAVWKENLKTTLVILIILCAAIVGGLASLVVDTAGAIGIAVLSVLLLWLQCMIDICKPIESTKVRIGDEIYRLLVYNTPGAPTKTLWLKSAKYTMCIYAEDYDLRVFGEYPRQFIYCPEKQDDWFLFGRFSGNHVCLGKRLAKTVFLAPSEQEDKAVLRILDDKGGMLGYKELAADFFVVGDMAFPLAKNEYMRVAAKEVPKPYWTAKAYDYLLVKNGGEYKLYGLFATKGQNPFMLEMVSPAVIFREGRETVILLEDKNGGYKELYRTESLIPYHNGNLVEIDTGVPMHGRILHFNPENKTIEKWFEGHLTSFGKDGLVTCADGEMYRPGEKYGNRMLYRL